MKKARYLLFVAGLMGCASIGFNESPAAKYQEAANRTFQYPKKDVFDACVSSLEANGWTVTSYNYDTGGISGTRRPYPGEEEIVKLQTATVSVVEVLPGKTEVKITAGLSSPNPGAPATGDALAAKELPKVCAPILDKVQETLLKGAKAGGK